MNLKTGLLIYIVALLLNIQAIGASKLALDTYNVVWNSPSKLASGQMPLGNGDCAAGIYAIEDGDLYLLLSKNDAFTYCGDIFKTGRVRISLKPNPFAKGKPFKQTLDLETGSIQLEADGVSLRVWADANRNLYHVEIDSPQDVSVSAEPEFWERFDVQGFKNAKDSRSQTQDVRVDRNGKILWYFAVGDRSVLPDEMKFYDVEQMIDKAPAPYRFNTFGNLLESPDLQLRDGALRGAGKRFDLRIHALTQQTPKVATWIEAIEKQAAQPVNIQKDWKAHTTWWSDFWNRSWISMTDNTIAADQRGKLSGDHVDGERTEKDTGVLVGQNYTVFRYLMACQSRGAVQVKFNGGLFTQPLYFAEKAQMLRLPTTPLKEGGVVSHVDDRAWGRRFTAQNQRLLYWPLLMSGDADLMKPFFDFYWDCLPIRKAITKAWFGHEGAYYRENIAPTGGEKDCGRHQKPPQVAPHSIDCNSHKLTAKKMIKSIKGKDHPLWNWYYHSFAFTAGLETVTMMIDYVNYSGDTAFRDDVLVPFANEIFVFFDKHYERDPNGKLRIDPGMVLETWFCAVNAAPDVAGLQFGLDGLLKMKAGSVEDQAFWKRFRAEIPAVYLQEIDGRKAIAPAHEWGMKINFENGELYPAFPFRLFGVALGTADLVEWTLENRTTKGAYESRCWTQEEIHFACAGNAQEAKAGLIRRYRHASTECRFPVYGRTGPDSCPDFDHFGSGSTALQRMLVQEADGKIVLLPAWPKEWDVDFKLHLEKQTVITGTVKEGKLIQWNIIPTSRKQDVTILGVQ